MPAPSPREHVERIRRERYFIGRDEQNPLAEDMHEAVNYLSQELYSKDVHFLMELVQNAEDNKYPCEVVPSLEFLITSKDITRSGASSTLLIFNNERGFSSTNIESICRVGKSTKKGNRHQGYIGEKGIGFKSVFLISSQPHIFSNGYHIKFNEKPCAECNIGYIVPEWVESTPRLSDIEAIYGCFKVLPTTTIILPLKNEKVDAVKKQLSSLHPEMLLFLSKIRKLSVREDNSIPESSTVTEIAISIENNFQSRKSMHAESYTLNLSAEESGKMEEECGYYVWRQKFPVKAENKVEKRDKIDEWVITLAFPLGERLSREKKLLPGVYAFLPTEMITDFPFIIQADFLLSSSREAILFDSPWNKGILECVPTAFMSAFVTLVKSTPDAPAMSLPSMFNFLPVNPSVISLLEPVRSGIKEKVLAEDIVPCESYASQKIFCKAGEVSRLKTEFWTILHNAREFGVDLKNLSSHGTYILSSHFDRSTYDSVLKFLEVKNVEPECYKDELEELGVTVEVQNGARFVISGLSIPSDPSIMSKATVMSLLTCIKSYIECGASLPKGFQDEISKKWVKTSMGYQCPDECILFDAKKSSLCMEDGPFIDEAIYGSELVSFKDSLARIGVIVNVNCGQDLVATHLRSHKKLLSDCVKVPVCADGMITLSKKEDVFIPDDLLLTDLFKKLPQQSLFIWYPPSTMPSMSRARLNSIYEGIGVQRISKAVMKNDSFTLENGCFRTVDAIKVIEVGLLRIILMFLADPALDIPAKERHKMVSCLLNVTVQETDQPITVSYKVILSSGEVVNVKDSRMLRWERERSELYMQSREGVSGYKEKIEFATYFAEEISRGILFEMADQIASLSDLIKFGSLLNFEDAAIGFLMKSKNLQLFPEDDDFLKSSVLCSCRNN
nr:unnamed protein product [Digitaria exilis]